MTLLKNDFKYEIQKTSLNKILVYTIVLFTLLLLSNIAAADTNEPTIHKISTADDLKKIGTDDFLLSDYYILTKDIQITDTVWNSIGNKTDPFTGTFDGDGHTITFANDVTLQNKGSDSENGYGLFGNIEMATITNINLKTKNMSAEGNNVGALVGYSLGNYGFSYMIIDCHVEIPDGSTLKGKDNVGGLIGYSDDTSIFNCSANISGSLESTENIGGLVGKFIGGNVSFSSVVSTGEMVNTAADNVGGLIGQFHYGAFYDSSFDMCAAEIESITTTGNNVGGFIGLLDEKYTKLTIEYCNVTVTGDIKGGANTGGFIGLNLGSPYSIVKNCNVHLFGDITGVNSTGGFIGNYSAEFDFNIPNEIFKHCSVTGNNHGTISSEFDSVGGFAGSVSNLSIMNCFSDLNGYSILGYSEVGGFIGTAAAVPLENCYSVVDKVVSETNNAGGFIGKTFDDISYNNKTIICYNNSYSAANNVTAMQNTAGGFIGYCSNASVNRCFSTGSVNAENNAGGLIGVVDITDLSIYVSQSYQITDCYSTADVSVTGDYSGGLIGKLSTESKPVKNCFAAGTVSNENGSNSGGLIGSVELGTIEECFYDINTTGQNDTGNGEPKNTDDMMNINTFSSAGWSITDKPSSETWYITGQANYPKLAEMRLPDSIKIYNENDLAKVGSGIYENGIHWSTNANYVLADNITMTKEFTPIAFFNGTFSGKNGNNQYIISNLIINLPNEDFVGLFADSKDAIFSDVKLDNVQITGKDCVGSLIGQLIDSQIINCSVTGGNVSGNYTIGGLIGRSISCPITDSSSSVDVYSNETAGGLIGDSSGTTINCSASGDVFALNRYAGGLFSSHGGRTKLVYNSSATGTVYGSSHAGGLVGYGDGTFMNCYATGNVDISKFYGGGLFGMFLGGSINNCYATGDVSGESDVGGLIGGTRSLYNYSDNLIENCFATGNVSASKDYAGGLVGNLQSIYYTISRSMALNENVSGEGNIGRISGNPADDGSFRFIYGWENMTSNVEFSGDFKHDGISIASEDVWNTFSNNSVWNGWSVNHWKQNTAKDFRLPVLIWQGSVLEEDASHLRPADFIDVDDDDDGNDNIDGGGSNGGGTGGAVIRDNNDNANNENSDENSDDRNEDKKDGSGAPGLYVPSTEQFKQIVDPTNESRKTDDILLVYFLILVGITIVVASYFVYKWRKM
ncbi:hypothetical protein LJC08_02815 [Methanimicrococcus sp. OttesenSCG-928-J09]|nr:hypothetical protein [Methanimicrococcus sp. OttesenSCG-928-J09]